MCGIGGIWRSAGIDPKELITMSTLMEHRGPDDEGYCLISPDNELKHCRGNDTPVQLEELPHIQNVNSSSFLTGLLHRRLSILDTSYLGHQPMSFANKFVLIFNGEIYNFRDIRNTLIKNGSQFKSGTDSEVLLELLGKYGIESICKCIGMWAFAIYDIQNKKLLLCRDRFGIKPLYYIHGDKYFAFASEIKPLLTLKECSLKADNNLCIEYISFGTQTTPDKTLFSDILEVPPGSYIELDCSNGTYTNYNYYSLREAVKKKSVNSDLPAISKEFEERFHESVQMHMITDVPLGSCLSGGLDSSAIVQCAAEHSEALNTFTASYPGSVVDESKFARQVVNHCNNIKAHYTFPDADLYWQDIDKMIRHQELPVNSTSPFAQWQVMNLVHDKGIKVLLDGQGADEILGGYYQFAGIYLIDLLRKWNFKKSLKEYFLLKKHFTPKMNVALARSLFYFLPPGIQRFIRAENRLGMKMINPAFSNNLKTIDVPARGGRSFVGFSIGGMKFGMRQLLRYEDRNSMAFSIEARVPFLEHRLVETALALPLSLKINDGWTKYILRKTLDNLLPEEVVWRKDKLGFVTPQNQWKQTLSSKLKQYLADANIPDIINRKYLIELCDTDLHSPSHQSEFWRAFSFIKWVEIMNVEFK